MKYIDLHCDALTNEGVLQTTKENLRRGGCFLQCFAAFVNAENYPNSRFARALSLCEKFEEMCRKEGYRPVSKISDIREGEINAMLAVEEGGAVEGSLEKLEILRKKGVRMMTLTWNYANEIGYPNAPSPTPPPLCAGEGGRKDPAQAGEGEREGFPAQAGEGGRKGFPAQAGEGERKGFSAQAGEGEREGFPAQAVEGGRKGFPAQAGEGENRREKEKGLTEFGRTLVERMKELSMIADVSHGSDKLVSDVAQTLKSPFAASHSGAAEVFPHPRNLCDGQIRLIADCGGVVGLDFCAKFLSSDLSPQGQREALLAHAEHILNVGGEDVLALGSDFDGIPENPYLKNPAYLPTFSEELQKKFGARIAEKILWKNALALFCAVL